MKTISRLVFVTVVLFSTSAFAQISAGDDQYNSPTALTDLQNHLQNLQSIEATLKMEIAVAQSDLISQQDLVASLDIQITDETDAGNDVSSMQAERSQALANIAALQDLIALKQSELASVQNEMAITNSSIQMLMFDKVWQSTYNAPAAPLAQSPNITQVPDPNNPGNMLMFFVPSGNAQQDEQAVRNWLFQRGLIDTPSDN